MGDLIVYNSSPPSSTAATPPASNNRSLPVREDCWSEEATATLVEAWGRRYVELNRGNLRQKDWQEVADTVNSLHGHSKKTYRTDVQCKNRIDTVKKKYKVEKARVVMSNGSYVSSWIFYNRMDVLIGPTTPASGVAGGVSHGGPSSSSGKKAGQHQQGSPVPLARSPPVGVPLLSYRKAVPVAGVRVVPVPVVAMAAPTAATAAVAVSLPHKRERERERDIRRNYSEVAAAAAAAEDMEDDDDELDRESEDEEELEKESEEEGEEGGMRRLAKAIGRFGEVYRRVEGEKLRQMVELEKQRMQFAKDLEVQRLKMFMDTQVQMERLKHAKRAESDVEEEVGFVRYKNCAGFTMLYPDIYS